MKILIISEFIAPSSGVASIRWTKISKYLKKNYGESIQIDILTDRKNFENPDMLYPFIKKDSILEKDMKFFDNYMAFPTERRFRFKYYLKKIIFGSVNEALYDKEEKVKKNDRVSNNLKNANSFKLLLSGINIEWRNIIFSRLAIKYIKTKAFEYDVVISTCGPIWPHMVGSKIKKINKNCFWIADFRDTYVRPFDHQALAMRHRRLSYKYTKYADIITMISKTIKSFARKDIRRILLPNGFDQEDIVNSLPPEKFSIVYTGTIYGELQDMSIIFRVLCELIKNGLVRKDDVEVVYAGSGSSLMKSFAKKCDAAYLLRDMGIIQRKEALKLQSHAAILLQSAWVTLYEEAGWTGKMYEYMASGKPIIYILNTNSLGGFVSRNIDRIGGFCYESCNSKNDYFGMKNYILAKYNEWKDTGNVTVVRDKDYVEQFSYSNISKKLYGILASEY